jgi:hypothetical protein
MFPISEVSAAPHFPWALKVILESKPAGPVQPVTVASDPDTETNKSFDEISVALTAS